MQVPRAIRTALERAGVDGQRVDAALARATSETELRREMAEAGLAAGETTRVCALAVGLPYRERLADEDFDPELLGDVSMQYCKRNRVLPLRRDGDSVAVAVADPLTTEALGDLQAVFGSAVLPVAVPESAVADAINRAFDRAAASTSRWTDSADDSVSLEAQAAELSEAPDLLEADDEAPIIRLVNTMIYQAARDGASDIHVEPFERATSVRFRIDGMLSEVFAPARAIHPALVSRIKVMASMNIAEKRLPQDGGIRTRVAGRELDIRVSTVPTSFGERVVMRLLDRSTTVLGLEELGLPGGALEQVRRAIRQSHGILLVTGPTGSGKTTTLYAALSEINSPEKNIITIEDPVEYQLRGVGQIQVNAKIGLTFAGGLRSVLRQDPDVIMVGEIRDTETARIAIQSALTGHLVFSTLHTNDAFSSVTRLLDMDVEPFLVSSSVLGILAQRLVRNLCPVCSRPAEADARQLTDLGIAAADRSRMRQPGPGCEACRGSGYKGRSAIAEYLPIDDDVRARIMAREDAAAIRDVALARGMVTMRADGATRVLDGTTSIEEVLRVTSEDAETSAASTT